MPRIVAIDYGLKRTGLAVTDENQLIAGPLASVESAQVIDFLKQYLLSEKVDCIVVGEPRQMNYEKSESAPIIEAFIHKLSKALPGVPIERADERFSSKIASQTLLESGIGKMKRRDKGLVDRVSAVVILQDYLLMKSLRN